MSVNIDIHTANFFFLKKTISLTKWLWTHMVICQFTHIFAKGKQGVITYCKLLVHSHISLSPLLNHLFSGSFSHLFVPFVEAFVS
jgi:hypothetical protein